MQITGKRRMSICKTSVDASYTKLKAQVDYDQIAQGNKDIHPDPWQGVYDLKPSFSAGFNADDSQAIADQFLEKRFSRTISILEKRNFTVLTGLTGVGKTTFVREMFADDKEYIVYYGKKGGA